MPVNLGVRPSMNMSDAKDGASLNRHSSKLSLAWLLPKAVYVAYALGVCILLLPVIFVLVFCVACGVGSSDCGPW